MAESQQPKKRRKPVGKSLRWTEQDRADLSEVKPADIKSAAEFWRAHAPPALRNLLDAEPDHDA